MRALSVTLIGLLLVMGAPSVALADAPSLLQATCTGTVGSSNLTCVDQNGTTVCTNNSGRGNGNSCTISGIHAVVSARAQSSSAQPIGIFVYNSSAATPTNGVLFGMAPPQAYGPYQSDTPSYGAPINVSNATVVISGTGAINSGGFTLFYY